MLQNPNSINQTNQPQKIVYHQGLFESLNEFYNLSNMKNQDRGY
jgi:hypothetical protein